MPRSRDGAIEVSPDALRRVGSEAPSSLSSKAHEERFIQRWNTPHRGANDPRRIQCVEQLVHFAGVSDNVPR